jgi:hypothetical protein
MHLNQTSFEQSVYYSHFSVVIYNFLSNVFLIFIYDIITKIFKIVHFLNNFSRIHMLLYMRLFPEKKSHYFSLHGRTSHANVKELNR